MKAQPLLPNADQEIIERMLSVIGVKSIDDLFSDIPKDLRLTKELKITQHCKIAFLIILK